MYIVSRPIVWRCGARSPSSHADWVLGAKVLLKHSRLAIRYEPDADLVKMHRGMGASIKGLEPRSLESALGDRLSSVTDRAEFLPISQT